MNGVVALSGLELLSHPEELENPAGKGWHGWPNRSITVEEAWFLYGLVRALRPAIVVEGGSGYSTLAMAAGLADNGSGRLRSYETGADYARLSRAMLKGYRLAGRRAVVNVSPTGSLAYDGPNPDLVFIDSSAESRAAEIAHWLAQPTFLAIHDAYLVRSTPDWLAAIAADVILDSPRGLWMRDHAEHRFTRGTIASTEENADDTQT